MVRVESARVRQHPEHGAAEAVGLPDLVSALGVQRSAIRREPKDGDDPRTETGELRAFQPSRSTRKLLRLSSSAEPPSLVRPDS